jgi:hypothetical protein
MFKYVKIVTIKTIVPLLRGIIKELIDPCGEVGHIPELMSILPQKIGDLIPPDSYVGRRATSPNAVEVWAGEPSVSIAVGAMILGEVVHHVQKSDRSTVTSYGSLIKRRSDIGVHVFF